MLLRKIEARFIKYVVSSYSCLFSISFDVASSLPYEIYTWSNNKITSKIQIYIYATQQPSKNARASEIVICKTTEVSRSNSQSGSSIFPVDVEATSGN